MDTGTGLVALAAALGGKELMVKLLGPSFDYLAQGPVSFAEWATKNLKATFDAAMRKADLEVAGNVPFRTLAKVVQEASVCEDRLAAEYFGGILASSRSGTASDDRATFFAGLVGRLSVSQIHAHCVLYSVHREPIAKHYGKKRDDRAEYGLNVPSTLSEHMAFEAPERKADTIRFLYAGLVSADLIHDAVGIGIVAGNTGGRGAGVVRGFDHNPTRLGIELFAAAHGRSFSEYFDLSVEMHGTEDVEAMSSNPNQD